MLKALWRFISNACWVIGAELLALKFLLMSLETTNVVAPTIELHNVPQRTVSTSPRDMEVIYEDKAAIEQLGDLRTNDVKIPKTVYDIN